jgi:hypothetical protein
MSAMSRVLDKQAFLCNPEIHPPSTPTIRSISTRRQRRRKHVLICGHALPANTSAAPEANSGKATDITS